SGVEGHSGPNAAELRRSPSRTRPSVSGGRERHSGSGGRLSSRPGGPDSSAFLLSPLDGRPETYREWGAWYFHRPFRSVELVRRIRQHRPLTDEWSRHSRRTS